ncbi:MAG: inositol monophosphatase family protein [Alphaproteobacteria bacterium]|nr:inositol monophosphatase family protein [Alphaproteobacteria bacterium]
MAARSAVMNVMVAAVEKAARGLVRDFGEVENLQVSKKGPGDFVSTADKKSESILISELSRARPGYSFLTEESGEIPGDDKDHRWIIDPLDGTTNFLHGIPHFAIVVALERQKEIIASVTYDPIKDELFVAEKGKGAFLNRRRLRVSGRRNLEDAVVGIPIPCIRRSLDGTNNVGLFQRRMEKISPLVSGFRRMGAAALDLAYVASGRLDVFFEDTLSPWDMAAGILLVKEAGGYVTEISGGRNMLNSGSILATNEDLHAVFQKTLSAIV